MTCSGKYFASCLYEDGLDKPKPSSEGKAVGIDLDINHFAITSDGSKKLHGSNNRNKARVKVAKAHDKIRMGWENLY